MIYLLDPPSPYSTPEEVQEWLDTLFFLEQTEQIQQAIKEANELMIDALELHARLRERKL